jgi:hypothetical protein
MLGQFSDIMGVRRKVRCHSEAVDFMAGPSAHLQEWKSKSAPCRTRRDKDGAAWSRIVQTKGRASPKVNPPDCHPKLPAARTPHEEPTPHES